MRPCRLAPACLRAWDEIVVSLVDQNVLVQNPFIPDAKDQDLFKRLESKGYLAPSPTAPKKDEGADGGEGTSGEVVESDK